MDNYNQQDITPRYYPDPNLSSQYYSMLNAFISNRCNIRPDLTPAQCQAEFDNFLRYIYTLYDIFVYQGTIPGM